MAHNGTPSNESVFASTAISMYLRMMCFRSRITNTQSYSSFLNKFTTDLAQRHRSHAGIFKFRTVPKRAAVQENSARAPLAWNMARLPLRYCWLLHRITLYASRRIGILRLLTIFLCGFVGNSRGFTAKEEPFPSFAMVDLRIVGIACAYL